MLNYFKPKNLIQIINRSQKFVFIIFILILILGLVEALILSPEDYKQSDSVRIMYVHVPAAWISLGIFSLISVLSFGIIIFKNKNFSLITKSLAPSGFVFNIIALVTGSIWGKPTWGTWWAWDARLTSELILFFLYLSILLLHGSFEDKKKAASAVNILAIIGFINIPIIHFSVEWWNTLHQGPSVIKLSTPSIAGEMLTPLIITALGFTLFFFGAMLKSSQNILLDYEKNKLWVKSI